MPRKKIGKFHNQIIQRADGKFDSKGEYAMWCKLKRMEQVGDIANLQRQVPFVLIDKSKYGREIKYIADYTWTDCKTGEYVVADFKSSFTEQLPVFKLKFRLMQELYDITIKILK